MTTRKTLFIDKATTLLLGLALIAAGGTAIWWWSGRTVAGRTLLERTDTAQASDLAATSWVAWVAAAVGVLIALIGLRWILAHVTSEQVKRLRLGGSGDHGRFEVLGGKVVGASADAFAETVGVRSASGTVVKDRGQMVAQLRATIEPDADLALLAQRADTTSSQLAAALERDDLRCSVRLRVAARGRPLPRAH